MYIYIRLFCGFFFGGTQAAHTGTIVLFFVCEYGFAFDSHYDYCFRLFSVICSHTHTRTRFARVFPESARALALFEPHSLTRSVLSACAEPCTPTIRMRLTVAAAAANGFAGSAAAAAADGAADAERRRRRRRRWRRRRWRCYCWWWCCCCCWWCNNDGGDGTEMCCVIERAVAVRGRDGGL